MSNPVCAIVGVGPGNGAALARRFATQGYALALCARSGDYLDKLCATLDGSRGYVYDVRDIQAAEQVFAQIRADLGPIAVLIYNAGAGEFSHIDQASVASFQAAWEVNARGLFLAAKHVIPHLRERKGGNIVIIGATASLTGRAGFLPFAAAKAAQRSVAQSLARHLGPERIHVAYVVIDGVIDLPRTRAQMPDKPDSFFMNAEDIAQTVFFLTQQPPQAWTFELDLRPFGEKW